MFGYGGGQPNTPNPVAPLVPVVLGGAGITMLPDTGASVIFVVLSYVTMAVGLAILASSVVRMIAAKRFNA